jgi:hypothetical protein
MGNECSHGSCSGGASHHGSKCAGCCCGSKGCNCCSGSKNCACQCHQAKYADQLLQLADEAWMEVVKEKIKEEIRQHSNETISQLAKLVATANNARWKDKLQSKKDHENFEDQLRNALCGGCCNK